MVKETRWVLYNISQQLARTPRLFVPICHGRALTEVLGKQLSRQPPLVIVSHESQVPTPAAAVPSCNDENR